MDSQDEQPGTLAEALRDAKTTGREPPPDDADFIVTKEYRRFTEFADAVRRDIGNQRYKNVLNDPLRETFAA